MKRTVSGTVVVMDINLTLPKRTLIVPIAIPGTGKSTLLGQVLPHSGFRHGADDVRRTMFGDVSVQGNPMLVHLAARHMLLVRMTEGLPCSYDATNLTVKDRRDLLVMADQNDYYTVAFCWEVAVATAKERNLQREQPVPEFVIDRMVKKLQPPTAEEAFDRLVYFDQLSTNLSIEWSD
jgi:predicted kinase